ncbi:MAG: response regulator [Myxococcales bacterium]|nr:response regulator [Myxococcales bacterium]
MRILCVEDERTLRGAVPRRLRAVGHVVDEVGTMSDALDQLHTAW